MVGFLYLGIKLPETWIMCVFFIKLFNLIKRESQLLQVADVVEFLHLLNRVVTIAGPFIDLVRDKKPLLFIVAQGFHSYLHHL